MHEYGEVSARHRPGRVGDIHLRLCDSLDAHLLFSPLGSTKSPSYVPQEFCFGCPTHHTRVEGIKIDKLFSPGDHKVEKGQVAREPKLDFIFLVKRRRYGFYPVETSRRLVSPQYRRVLTVN